MILAMPPSLPNTEQPRPTRAELLCLAGAILLGAILRLGYPGRMAIEHFDEGVYASNFWFGTEEGYEYPARHLYAPPLLPAAIEWTMIIASLCGIRPTGFIPMIPSLIAGMATIPSIWWVGRRWFGPSAGIVSACLVAASDFHSSYSRAALTDVPVCLFILWGVYFTWQAMQTGTRRDIILAALFTALAWWTKYNGWLPLAVGLSGGVAWQITLPRADRQLVEIGKRWLLVAGLSFLLWSPVLLGLQKHGGYSAVAANHRQYVGRVGGWSSAALKQLTYVGLYDNWWGMPYEVFVDSVGRQNQAKAEAIAKAEGRPLYDRPEQHRIFAADLLSQQRLNRLALSGDYLGQTSPLETSLLSRAVLPHLLILATPVGLLVAGLLGCAVALVRNRSTAESSKYWFLLAWICGLSLAIPFYQSYPRLVLPWLIAVWLGAGMAIEALTRRRALFGDTAFEGKQQGKVRWIEILLLAWLLICTVARSLIGTTHAWQDRSLLSQAAESIAAQVKGQTVAAGFPGDEAIVYVFGEPAVVFSLKASGLSLIGPVQNLDFLNGPHPRPTFFVRSGRAYRSDVFGAAWESHRNDFETFGTKRARESSLVQFDEGTEFSKQSELLRSDESLWVYRVR